MPSLRTPGAAAAATDFYSSWAKWVQWFYTFAVMNGCCLLGISDKQAGPVPTGDLSGHWGGLQVGMSASMLHSHIGNTPSCTLSEWAQRFQGNGRWWLVYCAALHHPRCQTRKMMLLITPFTVGAAVVCCCCARNGKNRRSGLHCTV